MGYIIRTLEDRLSNHVFEINGAIALRNYSAQVNGNRITITSTQNDALSILECEVSEVEIDGTIYDNAVDAQQALNSIVYADLPIVVLTQEEKEKLILKVSPNHEDAAKLIQADGTLVEPTSEAAVLDDVDITDTGGYMQFNNTEGDLMAQISVEAIKQAMDLGNITGDFE